MIRYISIKGLNPNPLNRLHTPFLLLKHHVATLNTPSISSRSNHSLSFLNTHSSFSQYINTSNSRNSLSFHNTRSSFSNQHHSITSLSSFNKHISPLNMLLSILSSFNINSSSNRRLNILSTTHSIRNISIHSSLNRNTIPTVVIAKSNM